MKWKISLMMIAISCLVMVAVIPSSKAMELKPGLDIKGQWERPGDKGYFARLKVLSVEGTKVGLAYGVGRFGYDDITKESLRRIFYCKISEPSAGIKEVKWTGSRSLADFKFEFNPGLPFARGTWTSTRNKTWQIEMK